MMQENTTDVNTLHVDKFIDNVKTQKSRHDTLVATSTNKTLSHGRRQTFVYIYLNNNTLIRSQNFKKHYINHYRYRDLIRKTA